MRLRTVVVVLGAHATLNRRLLSGPILTRGATAAEATGTLPGVELLVEPHGASIRKIEIDAPAAAVWPWLVELGSAPRAGAQTYDWIQNLLDLDMHSADHTLPEFQDPQVGDTIVVGPNRMRLCVKPKSVLILCTEDSDWVWTFIHIEDGGSTRLIRRDRFRLPTFAARVGMVPMEPASP